MRRRLLTFALGAAVLSAPLFAVEKYIAIGDSITAGSTWPCTSPTQLPVCPLRFDCTGGCALTPQAGRDKCGHVRRLDAWLGGGADNYVRNEGVGGEKTAAAVSRFANEMNTNCDTPDICNAVILMHGTNDMGSNVSPESATFNLATMVGEAKARGIDTLLMTIIRDYNENHPKWQLYRDLTADLAASENLQLIDTHAALCPNAACRNANYFLNGSSPCNYPDPTLGTAHLDPDGYDVLTGLIQAQFPGSVPLEPQPASPTGDIADTQPDFVWPEVASARWYELDIDGATSWWEASAHCAAGTCTANPGVTLAKGVHSWRLRSRNLRGKSDWSGYAPFEIWGIPAAPVTAVPSGLIIDQTPASAPYEWEPYTWDEDPEATDYDLEVSNGGGPVLMQSFDSSICFASVCEAAPDFDLGAGGYTWTVTARNPAAIGPASSPLAFQVWNTVPAEPTPTGPTGDHFEPFAPLYEWLPADGATEYDLEVRDAGGNVDETVTGLLASAVCAAGSCSYQGVTLTDPDDYTLRVLGRNDIGAGALSSSAADFTILACADPSTQDLDTLEPPPVTTTETVTHCGPVTAGAAGAYTIDVTGDLTVHTRDGFTAFDGFTVEGTLTVRTP